jgi:hypothetical protein
VTATIILCLLSTISFCLALRGLVAVAYAAKHTPAAWSKQRFGFSGVAWRIARAYIAFALVILAAASLFGAFNSYLELFNSI